MKKDILIVITKGEIGGAQTSVFHLAEALGKRGHKVTVGFGTGEFLESKLKERAIPYRRFSHLKRSHNPLRQILFFFEMLWYLRKNPFDAIHFNSTNTLLGALAAKLLGKKPRTVFTFRGLSILDENYQDASTFVKKFYIYYFRFFLLFVDVPVFVSNENQKQAEKHHITSKGITIYNGLNPEAMTFLSNEDARAKLQEFSGAQLEGKFVIGSVGRLSYQKNYEFLIERFHLIQKKVPNAVLLIAGSGPNKEQYTSMIKERSLRGDVFLLGDVVDAHKYLRGLDLFVLPARYEGMPIVLIETLFAGAPVIASDVNGNREVLGESGYLYPLDDEDVFLQFLEQCSKPETLTRLSREAKERSKTFHIERTADGYERALSSRGPSDTTTET